MNRTMLWIFLTVVLSVGTDVLFLVFELIYLNKYPISTQIFSVKSQFEIKTQFNR